MGRIKHMPARKQIDWEAIEKLYRIGQMTVRAIALKHGISHVAIVKKAQREGWVQDKSEEVRQKTKAALLSYQREITKKITTPTKEEIDTAVQTNVVVVTEHRIGIKASQNLVQLFQDQLKEAATKRDQIESSIIDETQNEEGKTDQKRRNMMLKAVSLPAHSGVLRDLSIAQKNLIYLERQAFNIDETGGDGESIEDRLKKIVEESK